MCISKTGGRGRTNRCNKILPKLISLVEPKRIIVPFHFFHSLLFQKKRENVLFLVRSHNHNSPRRSGNPLDPLEPSWKSRAIDDTLLARRMEQGRSRRRGSRDKATEKPERVSQYWSKGGGVQCPRARHRVCDRAPLFSLFLSLSLSCTLSREHMVLSRTEEIFIEERARANLRAIRGFP